MENETAGDLVQVTPADSEEHPPVETEEPEENEENQESQEFQANMKETDGRLKVAISALVRSTVTADPGLREGSSQSLSRIARVQPLTVLSEWLLVLSSEREKAGKAVSGKKKSSDASSGGGEESQVSGPACLLLCLQPVLTEITKPPGALNSGNLTHRAAVGQVISALVEEMINNNSQEKTFHHQEDL